MLSALKFALFAVVSIPAFAGTGTAGHPGKAKDDVTFIDPRVEVVGTATYTFENRDFAKYFKKTLVFGHSISSGLMRDIGVFNFLHHYGEGPGTVLAQNYAKGKVAGNISEGIGTMETGLTKMYRWVEEQDDFDSAPGDNRRLSVMNKYFNEATAIVGVDALYMTVVFNECQDYGKEELRRTIDRFVNKSYYAGKILVLGSVPKEDWWSVSVQALAAVYNNNEDCRQMVNTALADLCKPDRNCYVNDVEGIVKSYNDNGYLTLNDGTKIYKRAGALGTNEVRPDGVNLSERGVQVLVEDILKKIADRPPTPLMAPPSLQPN